MGNGNAAPRAIKRMALIGIGLAALAAPTPGRAQGLRLDPKEIIPIREVHPGMKGYGLTVFKGTTISRFQFEVLEISIDLAELH